VVGERLTDADVDIILKLTGTEEDLDGNIKYEGSFTYRLSTHPSFRQTQLRVYTFMLNQTIKSRATNVF